jgi:hypothetical protein
MILANRCALPNIFLRTIIISALSFIFSWVCFSENVAIFCTGLIALGLSDQIAELLEENRENIWANGHSPWIANFDLSIKIAVIFAGIFMTAVLFYSFYPGLLLFKHSAFFGEHTTVSLIQTNYPILIIGLLYSFVFGSGGLTLILAWNALNWSQVILYIVTDTSSSATTPFIFLPHLFLEVLAYVLAGMAGTFLFKAFKKYKFKSGEFYRVERASAIILVISIFVLALAALAEVNVAQRFLNRVHKGSVSH